MKRILPTIFLITVAFLSKSQTIYYSLVPELNTVSESGLSLSLSSSELNARDIEFSNDGLKLFMLGFDSDLILGYNLSSPFDITTVGSSVDTLNVFSQENFGSGFTFNRDGTQLFLTGNDQDRVHEYELTTPFSLSSASVTGNNFEITQDVSPFGIDFSLDGTKMYILGNTNMAIYEYDLSTAFDITTAVYNGRSMSVSDQSSEPTDLKFSADGSHVFVLADGNKILKYEYGTGTFTEERTLQSSSSNNGFAFSRDFTQTALINSSATLTSLSVSDAAFTESSDNDGSVEGSLLIAIVGDTLVNAGSQLELNTHYTIDNLVSGLTPSLQVGSGGFTATLSLGGQTFSNEDVSSLQFTFTNDAFVSSAASEVINATGPAESNLGIDFTEGGDVVIDALISANNDVITELGLNGNRINIFSWKTRAGSQETVVNTATLNASFAFGSILENFQLFVGPNADGSGRTQLTPSSISVSQDSLVVFEGISDTLSTVEEVYYFVSAVTNGVTTATSSVNFALASTNFQVTGPSVASATVTGSQIDFTELAFTTIGAISNAAYGEAKLFDIDSDDDLDVVVAGRNNSEPILRYHINTDGDFAPRVNFGSAKDSVRLVIGDFDNDSLGEMDFLIQGFVTDNNGTTLYTNSDFTNSKEFDTDGGNLVNGDVAAGDFDGDGDLDVIMTGHEDASVSTFRIRLFRNDGNNNYTLIDSLTMTPVIDGDIEVGDVDNDGDLDIFVTGENASGNPVSDLYIRGATGFELSASAFTGVSESSADFGDFDGDGYLDLAVSGKVNDTGPTLSSSIYINGGDGSFTASTSLAVDSIYAGDIKWVDLDNDGDLDLVQTGKTVSSQKASIWLSDGTTLTESYVGNLDGLANGNISYGDIDGDDDPDLAIIGENSSSTFVTNIYENSLFSGFVSEVNATDSIGINIQETQFTVGWNASGSDEYEVFVVRGDSSQEVLVRSAEASRLNGFVRNPEKPRIRNATYEINNVVRGGYQIGVQSINSANKGSEFRTLPSFFNGTPFTPVAAAASNITGNGFQANWNDQLGVDSYQVTLIRQETVGGVTSDVIIGTFTTSDDSYQFSNLRRNRTYKYTVQALNGALVSGTSNEVTVNLSTSTFFTNVNVIGLADDAYESLALADFNGDDRLDIVAATGTNSFVLLNDGAGTSVDLNAPTSSSAIEVFDFGKDGDIDILMVGQQSGAGRTSFFQNDANTYTETVTNSSQFTQAKITSGDIDNDGDVDMVLMGTSSGSALTELITNNGTNFDASSQSFIADTEGDLGLSDFDLDGDLDLLILGSNQAQVYINESGTLTGSARTFDFLNGIDLKLADMTGDGRPDVVYSGTSGSTTFLKIYSTNDTLGFQKITDLDITTLSTSAPKIELIDSDNDGNLDVFVLGSESIEVYSNTTNGVLTTLEALQIGASGLTNGVTAFGDYDRDGDIDVLFSGNNGSSDDAGFLANTNNSNNNVPLAPANLGSSIQGENFRLVWDPASDTETGADQLTYNVLIQNAGGTQTYQSANPENGFRRVPGYGSIQDTTWKFSPVNLPTGEYTWKVQSIDANGQGSAFSAESIFTVPDTLKIFSNLPAIRSGQIDGGEPEVAFFSFGLNSSSGSTLDSLSFNLNGDYRAYMEESTFQLFTSVDANPDLSPEDRVVDAVPSSDGTTLSVGSINVALSQQQVYFFLVAQTKFVAAEGEFSVTLDASNVFVLEDDFVSETNSLTGNSISVLSAQTSFTPFEVNVTQFERSSQDATILSFSLSANVPRVTLNGLTVSSSTIITDKFENIRLYSSENNFFDASIDTELSTFDVADQTMTASLSSVLPGANTEQFYFVVADVGDEVRQATEPISLSLNSPADFTFTPTNIDAVAFTSADYTFYFDLIPPVIRYTIPDASIELGQSPREITFTVTDESEITSVDFFWRKLNASSFERVPQTPTSSGSYTHTFSADDIGEVGVEFYAQATDLDGNINDPDVQTIGIILGPSSAIDIVSEASIEVGGKDETDYTLFALPFERQQFDNVLRGLDGAKHGFLDQLFRGNAQDTKWRLWGLTPGASGASGFQPLTMQSTYEPGRGYYLIVGLKKADIDIASARTIQATSDNPHSVQLSSGWNLIGNPYLFSISIENLRNYNLAADNITDASVINDIVLFKNGGFRSSESTMERFDGAFIRVTEDVSRFQFPMNDDLPSNSGGRVDFTRWDQFVEEDDWRLDLTISQGGQTNLGGIGIKTDALGSEDVYDQHILPSPGDYIRMQHEIQDELTSIRSSVKAPELVNVWNTAIHAVKDGVMNINWDHESVRNLSRSLYLFDPVGLRFIDMKSSGSTSLSVKKGSNELLFFYGPEDLKGEAIAEQTMLIGQVYPNPVYDEIGLNVLAQAGTSLNLKLYNLNGQEVLSKEHTLDFSGINTLDIAINGRLKSGLYFLEVQLKGDQGVYRNRQKVLINE